MYMYAIDSITAVYICRYLYMYSTNVCNRYKNENVGTYMYANQSGASSCIIPTLPLSSFSIS
jgi:hypothetical protein